MKYVLLLFVLCLMNNAYGQKQTSKKFVFPQFVPDKNEAYEKYWNFIPYFKNEYNAFVAHYVAPNWGYGVWVNGLGIKGDSAFVVTYSFGILDTPKTFISRVYLPDTTANRIIHTLSQKGLFTLKKQSQISPCILVYEQIHYGKKIKQTRDLTSEYDGDEIFFILYDGGKTRYLSYYDLSEAKTHCPQNKDWQQAVGVHESLKNLLAPYVRKKQYKKTNWEKYGQ